MHIGFVTTESPYGRQGGGIATYLRAMIPALLKAGNRVTLFANSDETRVFHEEDGQVPVHHFRLPSTHWYTAKVPVFRGCVTLPWRQLEWSAAFYRQVTGIAKTEKIDVLEATEAGALFLSRVAPLVIRQHGSEYVFRKHCGMPLNPSVRWNDSLEAMSSQRALAITAPSRFQADELARHRGWPKDRIHIIPNPISASILSAARETTSNGHSETIVLYTGRLAPVKGIKTLLDAAKLVRKSNQKVTFVLAGPWQMPGKPEDYGISLDRKADNGIIWIGPKEQSDLIDWYRRASLFVMPSYYESFGTSVVEAMAFGLPVVCTRVGRMAEAAPNGGAAQLFTAGDSQELANAILDVLSNLSERREKSLAARNHIYDTYAAECVSHATLKVYEQVRAAQN